MAWLLFFGIFDMGGLSLRDRVLKMVGVGIFIFGLMRMVYIGVMKSGSTWSLILFIWVVCFIM